MKVLLIGGGGREHALAWALSRSSGLRLLRCAPGNAGIRNHAECIDLAAEDVDGLLEHARAERYDLVVVGPEAPLVEGLADRLRDAGIAVFGPSAAAARIEGSKVFAKRFMSRHGLPSAAYRVFDDPAKAREFLSGAEAAYPLVVKADGLAAGKGVIMADDAATAIDAAVGMLEGRTFGAAGSQVVVEERLTGREASFFVVSDGERFVELATCQDYKRAEDGDRGLNTGGMGTYSPSVYLDEPMRRTIIDEIVRPSIHGLAADGSPYRGVLYVGLMLTETGPKVLEYNARFGDPETQVLMPRLDGEWLPVLHACATGSLSESPLRWKEDAAVCVVMASDGYPGTYRKGLPIEGIDRARELDEVEVFHAGTSRDDDGRCVTSGGRVLGVTALGAGIGGARQRAYRAVQQIRWDGARYRTDIAADAVLALQERAEP